MVGIRASLVDQIKDLTESVGFSLSDSIAEILVSVGVIIAFLILGWIVFHVFERFLSQWAKNTKTTLDDEIIKNIKKPIYFLVILIGAKYALEFPSVLQAYKVEIEVIFAILPVFVAAFIVTRVVNVLIAWMAEKRKKQKISEHILFILKKIINFCIYIIALLVVLAILDIDLTGIFVGMGVMGIAIGFALQNVLSDFFSTFSIYFDKPFQIGDFIIVGDHAGVVKKIGMKSTRVQLLQGEELVLANSELTSASVRNFKKMKRRRISFTFGVTYDTPNDKLKKIPDIIKSVIDPEKLNDLYKLDRVHFTDFGDFSLNFEIVYFLKTQDYLKYMDTQQAINFGIRDAFEKEGIEMAFPTQTIYVEK